MTWHIVVAANDEFQPCSVLFGSRAEALPAASRAPGGFLIIYVPSED